MSNPFFLSPSSSRAAPDTYRIAAFGFDSHGLLDELLSRPDLMGYKLRLTGHSLGKKGSLVATSVYNAAE